MQGYRRGLAGPAPEAMASLSSDPREPRLRFLFPWPSAPPLRRGGDGRGPAGGPERFRGRGRFSAEVPTSIPLETPSCCSRPAGSDARWSASSVFREPGMACVSTCRGAVMCLSSVAVSGEHAGQAHTSPELRATGGFARRRGPASSGNALVPLPPPPPPPPPLPPSPPPPLPSLPHSSPPPPPPPLPLPPLLLPPLPPSPPPPSPSFPPRPLLRPPPTLLSLPSPPPSLVGCSAMYRDSSPSMRRLNAAYSLLAATLFAPKFSIRVTVSLHI